MYLLKFASLLVALSRVHWFLDIFFLEACTVGIGNTAVW